MFLTKRYEIQSKETIIKFLNQQQVGRIATIDQNNYPQIIPMNYVYVEKENNLTPGHDVIYMHSHPKGEKISNIQANDRAGFEVDEHICFLPSYYFHPSDPSQADTLYVSVVIKGRVELVSDIDEKVLALNKLMEKYQKEGQYIRVNKHNPVVREVAIIKIIPHDIRGKYKTGQQWSKDERLRIAKCIFLREGKNSAENILDRMGIRISKENVLKIEEDPRII